jgi:tetratricopeptide (TPR) repeat protein
VARPLVERAIQLLEAAYKGDTTYPDFRNGLVSHRQLLVEVLLRQKDYPGAARTIAELLRLDPENAEVYYQAGRCMARCVPLANGDPALAESKRQELAQGYAGEAVVLLRQAVQRGYKDGEHMKKDTDLDPIRYREDFKKLVAELEAKGRPAGK